VFSDWAIVASKGAKVSAAETESGASLRFFVPHCIMQTGVVPKLGFSF